VTQLQASILARSCRLDFSRMGLLPVDVLMRYSSTLIFLRLLFRGHMCPWRGW